jgi:hypothetical protein
LLGNIGVQFNSLGCISRTKRNPPLAVNCTGNDNFIVMSIAIFGAWNAPFYEAEYGGAGA